MIWLFSALCALYISLVTLKLILTIRYWGDHHRGYSAAPERESRFSVIQPILSGDRFLEQNLRENLENHPHTHFLWMVDADDPLAQEIVQRIQRDHSDDQERIQVIEVEAVPQGLNPKIFKMKFAVPFLREYTVVLDDDTVIAPGSLTEAFHLLQSEEMLLTGVPYYRTRAGLFSDLVAGFVNANALFTYLPVAATKQIKTINGMFYVTSTETLKALDAFTAIEALLCDDYEIAKLYRAQEIPLFQSAIPCKLVTDVKGLSHYLQLMKRWMVFVNRFTKENLSWTTSLLVLAPSFLPTLLLGISLWLGPIYVGVFCGSHIMKLLVFSYIRSLKTSTAWRLQNLFFEWLSEYLQILHYIHAALSPRRIQWRTRDIDISQDSIRYQ